MVPAPRRGRVPLKEAPINTSQIALLIDDEPVSCSAQKARLEGEGFSVFVAQNHADGLTRAREVAPKVIVLHLVTGGQSNLAFMQALRSTDAGRHTPVVIVADRRDVRIGTTKLHAVRHDSW